MEDIDPVAYFLIHIRPLRVGKVLTCKCGHINMSAALLVTHAAVLSAHKRLIECLKDFRKVLHTPYDADLFQ